MALRQLADLPISLTVEITREIEIPAVCWCLCFNSFSRYRILLGSVILTLTARSASYMGGVTNDGGGSVWLCQAAKLLPDEEAVELEWLTTLTRWQ